MQSFPQLTALLLVLASCTGTIGDASPDELAMIQEVPFEPVAPAIDYRCAPSDARARVVALSPQQLDATVAAYLGPTFRFAQVGATPARVAEQIAAERAASEVAGLGCAPQQTPQPSPADPCITRYLADRGKQLFHRPPTTTEATELYRAYLSGFAGDTVAGVRAALLTMLQSTQFANRTEQGRGSGTALTSHELAAAIAYTTTNAPPDAELTALADSDALDASTVATEVRRLMATNAGRATLTGFVTEWLATNSVLAVASDAGPITDSVARAMITETELTIDQVLFEGSGTLAELLTTPFTYANRELAEFYGYDGPTSDAFERVSLDGLDRPGILAHGSFSAAHALPPTSILHRGNVARNVLFCESLPSKQSVGLPADFKAPKLTPNPRPDETRRQQVWREDGDLAGPGTSCYTCHQYFTPIGTAFEAFDDYGRSRTHDNGWPVDPSGSVVETIYVDPATGQIIGPFHGITQTDFADYPGLTEVLADNDRVSNCAAKKLFMFARSLGSLPSNDCDVRDFATVFADNGGSFTEAYVAFMSNYLVHRVVQ